MAVDKEYNRDAWLKSLQAQWENPMTPRIYTRVGDIYEIEFGENIGSEFSGTHFGVCLSDTMPSQNDFLVIPITSKVMTYNNDPMDIINVNTDDGFQIYGAVVRFRPMWLSKKRIHLRSSIIGELEGKSYPKAHIEVSTKRLKAWRSLT